MQLKVYRRDNRKKDQKRWRRLVLRTAVCVCAGGMLIAGYQVREPIALSAASLRDSVLESSYFSVREIQVRGSDKVSGNEIVNIAGLRHGMSIWKTDLAGIEKKISQHPWVRHVFVRREFPGRIIIDVEERTPKAIVAIRKLYYVDTDGVIFKEVDPGESLKFPLLTGLHAEEIMAASPALRRRIRDAIRLGEMMAQRSHSLSEIHFDAPDQLVVFTTTYPVGLNMGWGEWEDKLSRMDRLLDLWKGHEDRLVSLDMNYRNQVVARLRRAQQ